MDGLKKAQELIQRLNKRELYKCCGFLLLSPAILAPFNPNADYPKIAYREIEKAWTKEIYDMFQDEMMNEEEDRECIKMNELRVQLMSLSFGVETKHPMKSAFFYSSNDRTFCKQVDCDQITKMGNVFREVIVRVYIKRSEWKKECEQIFRKFVFAKGLVQNKEYDFPSLFISEPQKRKTANKVSEEKVVNVFASQRRKKKSIDLSPYVAAFKSGVTKKVVVTADCNLPKKAFDTVCKL